MNNFIEEFEVTSISIFENPDLGFSEELDDLGFPVANFFDVEIFLESEDFSKKLETELKNKFKEQISNFKIELVNNQDWISLYIKELTPVLCDKFYFYNDSIQDSTDNRSLIPIRLNSALAFGSGHHQTTKGCLLNLIFLEDSNISSQNILDMGCGTGILGICALKLWPKANLLGIDIDSDAVEITKSNYEANEIKADSYQDCNVNKLIFSDQKFDLILCNILKQPLMDLCSNFYDVMNEEAYIITSGYIKNQEKEVIECYLKNNFELVNKVCIEDWLAILFKKRKNG